MQWHLFTQNKPTDTMASALMPVQSRLNMSLITVAAVLGVMTYSGQAGQLSCGASCIIWLPWACSVSHPACCALVNCYFYVHWF